MKELVFIRQSLYFVFQPVGFTVWSFVGIWRSWCLPVPVEQLNNNRLPFEFLNHHQFTRFILVLLLLVKKPLARISQHDDACVSQVCQTSNLTAGC